ncbi:MAG: xanthine dehydrogenase family protein subunit M [Candidatus Hydrogenedentota bacterium]|nr:MAG: xanthine dehydrogenase family protein subunit M [Candidatus Hydrogenedentota bacterium]
MIREFSYQAPRKQKELLDILASERENARVLAGGTDLLVNIRLGLQHPRIVVDIKKIREHTAIRFDEKEGLSIGAAVTINEVMENRDVQKHFPALVEAAKVLASHQLRNRATVIGNLCNASPCADMAPPLLCLDARVEIVSDSGRRNLPLEAFFAGVKKTRLTPGEYVERIVVPPRWADAGGGFRKMKRVRGHDIGVLSVCLTKKGPLRRVAVGSAAPTPVLVGEFRGRVSTEEVIRKAMRRINPIDDVRGSAEFRRFLTRRYVAELMKEVR